MELATRRLGANIDPSSYRGYAVQLDAFEGPLDLLLEIIKRNREDIWEISISRITRQYLEYLATLQALNIEVAGEFLVMAATMMRIKSQMLLPRPTFLAEGGGEEEAPLTREGLIAKLLEYRRFKEAAVRLREREVDQGRRFIRGAPAVLEDGYVLPLREPRIIDLVTCFKDVLDRSDEEAQHEVQLEEVALEDQMELIRSSLGDMELEALPEGSGQGLRFSRLLRRQGSVIELVVTFLAVLELAKLQSLSARQAASFAEIWLTAFVPRDLPELPETGGEEAGP